MNIEVFDKISNNACFQVKFLSIRHSLRTASCLISDITASKNNVIMREINIFL